MYKNVLHCWYIVQIFYNIGNKKLNYLYLILFGYSQINIVHKNMKEFGDQYFEQFFLSKTKLNNF